MRYYLKMGKTSKNILNISVDYSLCNNIFSVVFFFFFVVVVVVSFFVCLPALFFCLFSPSLNTLVFAHTGYLRLHQIFNKWKLDGDW